MAVPCKLYGILATGRAIIAAVPKTSETARVIEEEHCGVLVAPGDAQGLADGILHLCNNPGIVAEMAENARSAYLRLYTLDSALNRFEQALATRVHN